MMNRQLRSQNSIHLVLKGLTSVLTIGIVAAALVFSCTRSEQGTPESQQIQLATDKIDQGNYDDAIQILEASRVEHPNSPETLTALASAYAGRAGISVQDYWGFVIGYDKLLGRSDSSFVPVVKAAKVSSPKSKNVSSQILELISGLQVNLDAATAILKRIEEIPYLSPDKRQDVEMAAGLMKGVNTEGGHLFRAILLVVLIRSIVQDAADLAPNWAQSNYSFCTPHFQELSTDLITTYEMLEQMISDLEAAYPSRQDQFTQLQVGIEQVSIVIDTLKSMDPTEAAELCAMKSGKTIETRSEIRSAVGN